MKIYIVIPTLLLIFTITSKGDDSNSTDTHIFVKFNHAEAKYEPVTTTTTKQPDTTTTTTEPTQVFTEQVPVVEDVPDTIVFVPNDKPIPSDDDNDGPNLRLKDIMNMKTVADAMDNNFHVETEPPPEDIVFISGKNTEFVEEPIKKKKTEFSPRRSGKEMGKSEKNKKVKLNCKDLDCNNTVNSICGGKKDRNRWTYRLFMNECYFRKVNCNFQHAVNRYKLVAKEQCSKHQYIAFSFNPKPFIMEKPQKIVITRKSFSSRRSLSMGIDGQFCSHPCPASCPDDYDPDCAVSATGQRRVFLNHCKLDLNSCSYGVVWHRRPLAECVGGGKADLRHNRRFIDWMQRVGMVDKRGRLSLN